MSTTLPLLNIFNLTDQAADTSAILDCACVDVLSVQVVSTAQTGSSVIALYESVDGSNWVAISGDTETITTADTNVVWHLEPVFSRYVKVLFTYGSGACTFSVKVTARNTTSISVDSSVPVTIA